MAHFKKQIITTEDVVAFFNKETGMNLTPVFNQYLRYAAIPVLQLKLNNDKLEYRWQTDEPNFAMPIEVIIDGKPTRLQATNTWQSLKTVTKNFDDVAVATTKFYIKVEKL